MQFCAKLQNVPVTHRHYGAEGRLTGNVEWNNGKIFLEANTATGFWMWYHKNLILPCTLLVPAPRKGAA